MKTKLGERFASALRELESGRDVERMLAVFADGAELRRMSQEHVYRGREAAHRFWSEYLGVFDQVKTDFVAVHELGDRAVLEWCSRGRLHGGADCEYAGVSVVEADDAGRVVSFRTYYDPSKILGAPMLSARKSAQQAHASASR